MNKDPKASRTVRIDLLGEAAHPKRPTAVSSPLSKMEWGQSSRVPLSVERSRYHELLQSIYDAVLITSLNGMICDANDRAVELFGHSRTECCTHSLSDLVAGMDEDLLETVRENIKQSRFALIQAYCLHKDGSTFPSEIAVNILQLEKERLCFFVRDVTQRRRAEEMLRMEHSAIENAVAGVVITDTDLLLEYANPAFAIMAGVASPEDLLGRDLLDILPDHGTVRTLLDEVRAQQQQALETHTTLQRGNGTEIGVRMSMGYATDEDGTALGITFSFIQNSKDTAKGP